MDNDTKAVRVSVTLNGNEFAIELADNPASEAFAALLPFQGEMSELNGNEKYLMLDETLPADPVNPGTIEAGDVMLYQSSCIVIFYETFPTNYSYTRIGKIEDSQKLKEAVGSGVVDVSFS